MCTVVVGWRWEVGWEGDVGIFALARAVTLEAKVDQRTNINPEVIYKSGDIAIQ